MANPVNWFQISGSDGNGLKTFYKKAFGWKMSKMPGGDGGMVAPEPGGIAGGISTSQDGKSSVAVYVGVDSIKNALKKIQKLGGTPAMDMMELPGGMGFIAGFVDPAGNWTGLWQAAAAPKKAAAKAPAKKTAAKKTPAKKAAAKKPAAKGGKKSKS